MLRRTPLRCAAAGEWAVGRSRPVPQLQFAPDPPGASGQQHTAAPPSSVHEGVPSPATPQQPTPIAALARDLRGWKGLREGDAARGELATRLRREVLLRPKLVVDLKDAAALQQAMRGVARALRVGLAAPPKPTATPRVPWTPGKGRPGGDQAAPTAHAATDGAGSDPPPPTNRGDLTLSDLARASQRLLDQLVAHEKDGALVAGYLDITWSATQDTDPPSWLKIKKLFTYNSFCMKCRDQYVGSFIFTARRARSLRLWDAELVIRFLEKRAELRRGLGELLFPRDRLQLAASACSLMSVKRVPSRGVAEAVCATVDVVLDEFASAGASASSDAELFMLVPMVRDLCHGDAPWAVTAVAGRLMLAVTRVVGAGDPQSLLRKRPENALAGDRSSRAQLLASLVHAAAKLPGFSRIGTLPLGVMLARLGDALVPALSTMEMSLLVHGCGMHATSAYLVPEVLAKWPWQQRAAGGPATGEQILLLQTALWSAGKCTAFERGLDGGGGVEITDSISGRRDSIGGNSDVDVDVDVAPQRKRSGHAGLTVMLYPSTLDPFATYTLAPTLERGDDGTVAFVPTSVRYGAKADAGGDAELQDDVEPAGGEKLPTVDARPAGTADAAAAADPPRQRARAAARAPADPFVRGVVQGGGVGGTVDAALGGAQRAVADTGEHARTAAAAAAVPTGRSASTGSAVGTDSAFARIWTSLNTGRDEGGGDAPRVRASAAPAPASTGTEPSVAATEGSAADAAAAPGAFPPAAARALAAVPPRQFKSRELRKMYRSLCILEAAGVPVVGQTTRTPPHVPDGYLNDLVLEVARRETEEVGAAVGVQPPKHTRSDQPQSTTNTSGGAAEEAALDEEGVDGVPPRSVLRERDVVVRRAVVVVDSRSPSSRSAPAHARMSSTDSLDPEWFALLLTIPIGRVMSVWAVAAALRWGMHLAGVGGAARGGGIDVDGSSLNALRAIPPADAAALLLLAAEVDSSDAVALQHAVHAVHAFATTDGIPLHLAPHITSVLSPASVSAAPATAEYLTRAVLDTLAVAPAGDHASEVLASLIDGVWHSAACRDAVCHALVDGTPRAPVTREMLWAMGQEWDVAQGRRGGAADHGRAAARDGRAAPGGDGMPGVDDGQGVQLQQQLQSCTSRGHPRAADARAPPPHQRGRASQGAATAAAAAAGAAKEHTARGAVRGNSSVPGTARGATPPREQPQRQQRRGAGDPRAPPRDGPRLPEPRRLRRAEPRDARLRR